MGCPYIQWKELHNRWKSTAEKNREHRKNRWVSELRRRFNRSLCVQIVAVGVLTQCPGLLHCTGACSVVTSVQPVLKSFTDQFKQALWNIGLLMHRCFDSEASVQPVLKRSRSPPKHALWNKVHLMHRCFSWDHRFNRCYRVFDLIPACFQRR